MAGRRTQGRFKAKALQLAHQPFGRLPAISGKGWIGRNRGNTQKLEKPVQRGMTIGVDLGENRVDGVHENLLACNITGRTIAVPNLPAKAFDIAPALRLVAIDCFRDLDFTSFP